MIDIMAMVHLRMVIIVLLAMGVIGYRAWKRWQ